jgi:hypothetical protein
MTVLLSFFFKKMERVLRWTPSAGVEVRHMNVNVHIKIAVQNFFRLVAHAWKFI